MALVNLGQPYPSQQIVVVPFPSNMSELFERPPGLEDSDWPPTQIVYIGKYLTQLGCKTVVAENHYIDRDHVSDVALFYSRSLRAYQNYCHRLHFFKEPFDQVRWREMVVGGGGGHSATDITFLQEAYLGFCVVRPEISELTGFGEASVSAQIRNLRKEQYGNHLIAKRPRRTRVNGEPGGIEWEYQMKLERKAKGAAA